MRGDDEGSAAGREQPVQFLHRADHIGDVLNDVDGANLAERAIGKWPGKTVEIGNHVGARVGVPVDADGARMLVDAAADVQDGQSFKGPRGQRRKYG